MWQGSVFVFQVLHHWAAEHPLSGLVYLRSSVSTAVRQLYGLDSPPPFRYLAVNLLLLSVLVFLVLKMSREARTRPSFVRDLLWSSRSKQFWRK